MSVPAPPRKMRPVRVQSSRFDDRDTMALTMIGGRVNFVPLRPGPFHGRFCQIDPDGFVLRRMAHGPLLMHGTAKPGHVALQLMARPVEGMTLNGDAFGASTLSVIPGGSEIQQSAPPSVVPGTVPGAEPPPSAVMPVWELLPAPGPAGDADLLLGSGRLGAVSC